MRKLSTFVLLLTLLISACKDDDPPVIADQIIALGEVVSLTHGSNSYTAVISRNDIDNTVVVKKSNLEDASTFVEFEVGKSVAVKGDEAAEEDPIVVRKIVSADNTDFLLEGVLETKEPNQGGYSAMVLRADEERFNANFSISNIGPDYKDFEIGDAISVQGELWGSSDELLVTVRDIY